MKIVYSNRLGTGIHSPFVYRLVTGIIFGKEDSRTGRFPGSDDLNKHDQFVLSLVVKLIRFMKPERVVMMGTKPQWKNLLTDESKESLLISADRDSENKTFCNNDLFIFGSIAGALYELPEIKVKCTWVLADTKELKMKEFMNKLRNSQEPSLTLEVNKTGIAIFSPDFHKQNYIIRNRFLF